jgi:alkanesulfonate monooxygenase SsuD/methylene tetrahydromethanopterin reductase-like flavin-dependent oxidoreductase (luciferase family)
MRSSPGTIRLRVLLEAHHGATYEQILALARTAEEVGFEAFFRSDHYLGIERGNPRFVPTDSWTTLAGLARETRGVRLGTLVTAATFRLPGVLAVTVATADAMSGGRVELGLGAAWYTQEHEMFGIPFPPIKERFDRLEEQLSIITGLWTTPPGERFSFQGEHYQVDQCANFPRPAQSPRPKLIVGPPRWRLASRTSSTPASGRGWASASSASAGSARRSAGTRPPSTSQRWSPSSAGPTRPRPRGAPRP